MMYMLTESGQLRQLPNLWVESPFLDPRFRLIPAVKRAIDEAVMIACSTVGDGEDGFVLDQTENIKPLELAAILREAADSIVTHTSSEPSRGE